MHLWKLLIAISMIAWYLPVLSFRNNKYFLFFLINSLVDPIYIVLRYTFHLQTYNYIPFVLLIESATLPVNDFRSRTISSIALFVIILNLGSNWFIELLVCEIVLSMMIFNLLQDAYAEFKKESSFYIFHLLLFVYFLRNALMIYFYYSDQIILTNYYTLFLIAIIVIPVLITFFGPSKKIKINRNQSELLPEQKIDTKTPNLQIVQFPKHKFLQKLTDSEMRVLSLLAEGYKTKEISEKLFICKRTVYFHSQNLKNKLNIDTTARLIKFAFENREKLQKIHKPAHFDSIDK